jgi:hypothetical protein
MYPAMVVRTRPVSGGSRASWAGHAGAGLADPPLQNWGQVSAIQRSMGADNHRLDSSVGRILDKLLGVEPVVNTGSSTPLKPRPTICTAPAFKSSFSLFVWDSRPHRQFRLSKLRPCRRPEEAPHAAAL